MMRTDRTAEHLFHAEMQAHFGLPRNSIIPLLHEYEAQGHYVPPALPPRRRNLMPLYGVLICLAAWVLVAIIAGAISHV
jgi:hypothetical protein